MLATQGLMSRSICKKISWKTIAASRALITGSARIASISSCACVTSDPLITRCPGIASWPLVPSCTSISGGASISCIARRASITSWA